MVSGLPKYFLFINDAYEKESKIAGDFINMQSMFVLWSDQDFKVEFYLNIFPPLFGIKFMQVRKLLQK